MGFTRCAIEIQEGERAKIRQVNILGNTVFTDEEIREDFEPVLVRPPYYLYDVSLPIRDMGAYVDAVEREVSKRWPDGMCTALGHMADGNLHFFVSPMQDGDFHAESDACVYGPLKQYGGSVSAEHGIGTEKIGWLSHSRTNNEIALMHSLKRTLDPDNLLNPGRVLIAE